MAKRRLQFGLRTLLVVMAISALGCAYIQRQAAVVARRNEFIRSHPQYNFGEWEEETFGPWPKGPRGIGWLRTRLGDHDWWEVDIPDDDENDTIERRQEIRALFPEILIAVGTDGRRHPVPAPNP